MTCISRKAVLLALAAVGVCSCGFKHAKYENPITKDTQQPDKQLFDKAIHDIEKGRYDVARLTLNTLINTYDSSEYLAKAKLAEADSWYRQGGTTGLTQAEQSYKDFELFYPAMAEAAEAQDKICNLHFAQMDKPDRDPNQSLRAELECKQVILQYPNSKFALQAEQKLREIQEVLAESEMRVGMFQHQRGDWASSSNRLVGLVDEYPLYSRADEALWNGADSFSHLGTRGKPKAAQALMRLVRDYPLSPFAEQAKKKLIAMEMTVPEPDPAAMARMKYEAANRTKPSMIHKTLSPFRTTPDTYAAAKSGTPQMTNPKPSIPISVPIIAADGTVLGFQGDVTVSPADSTTPAAAPDGATATPAAPSAAPGTSTTPGTTDSSTTNSSTTDSSKGKKKNKK
jgi:outer membrane protein assembly factor BamD